MSARKLTTAEAALLFALAGLGLVALVMGGPTSPDGRLLLAAGALGLFVACRGCDTAGTNGCEREGR